jgi:hypothetical protein
VKQEEACKNWPAGQPVPHVPYDVHKLEGHPAGQYAKKTKTLNTIIAFLATLVIIINIIH